LLLVSRRYREIRRYVGKGCVPAFEDVTLDFGSFRRRGGGSVFHRFGFKDFVVKTDECHGVDVRGIDGVNCEIFFYLRKIIVIPERRGLIVSRFSRYIRRRDRPAVIDG